MTKYDQLNQLKQKALLGDIHAQLDLAETFDEGHPRNVQQAYYWYKIAASRGNPHALNNLAFLYEHGRGVTKNRKMALKYYKKAANKGNVIAMANLGVMMHADRKFRRARLYFEQAIASGDEPSKLYIQLYNKKKEDGLKTG